MHNHYIGQPGTGKTEHILTTTDAAIQADEAVIFIDPNGDAVDRLATIIPPRRYNHTVLFDFSREDEVPVFNFLGDGKNAPLIASISAEMVKDVSGYEDTATPVLWNYLFFSFAALSEAKEPLYGWRYILTDPMYRSSVLDRVTDIEVLSFWEDHESYKPQRQSELIASCLNKATLLMSDPRIRRSLAMSEMSFNVSDTLKRGILLVKLPQRILSKPRVELYGSLLISGLLHHAERRNGAIPLNFITDDSWLFAPSVIKQLVASPPGANIRATVVQQYIKQLKPACYDAVVGAAQMTYIFRTSRDDATALYDRMELDQKRTTRFDQLVPYQFRFAPFWSSHRAEFAALQDGRYPDAIKDIRWRARRGRVVTPQEADRAIRSLRGG
ncbi:hypothetical protein [Tsuneonella sp. HG222]